MKVINGTGDEYTRPVTYAQRDHGDALPPELRRAHGRFYAITEPPKPTTGNYCRTFIIGKDDIVNIHWDITVEIDEVSSFHPLPMSKPKQPWSQYSMPLVISLLLWRVASA